MGIIKIFTSVRELAQTAMENYLSTGGWDENYWVTFRERRNGLPNYELMRQKTDAENVLSRTFRSTRKYRHYKRTSDEISAILAERRASGLFIPEPQQQQQYVIHQPTATKRVTHTKIVRQEPEKTKRRRIRLGIGIGFWF